MPGTEKYWIDGHPNVSLVGDGTQKYWIDGSPVIGIAGSASGDNFPGAWVSSFNPNPKSKAQVQVYRIAEFCTIQAFFDVEALHINWFQPLSEPIPPPRIHPSQIPYDAFRPVYFAPEDIHVGNWFQELATPAQPRHIETQNIPFEFSSGPFFGGELNFVDKWYHPLEQPGRPRHLHVSEMPFNWLVQFSAPILPVPSVATWYEALAEPIPPRYLHPSEVPFTGFIRLPAVYGCIEAEIDRFYIPRGRPVPQMPILYITKWYLYSTAPPPCATTRQSPGSQPPHSGD